MAFWGPATATLEWCEENYVFTRYVAEIANSLSNFVTIALATYGTYWATRERLPAAYVASFILFAVVGLGSFAFHATLLYTAQLADEIPMIICVSHVCFLLFSIGPGAPRARTLAVATVVFDAVFILAYSIYHNPLLHQGTFAVLILTAAYRGLRIGRFGPLSYGARKHIGKLLWIGASTFAFGFVIWNADNVFCGALTRWKHIVQWPTAFLLEGHAWWHVLTAVGTYLMLVGVTYLSLCVREGEEHYYLAYTGGVLPRVVRSKLL